MFTFLKGLFAGAVMAFAGAAVAGRLSDSGGILHVFHFEFEGMRLYWSWALFVLGTALGWLMFTLVE